MYGGMEKEFTMQRGHISFVLESAYGHILPTLGIASALVKRGYHVSYAVSKEFAGGIEKIGAEAIVYCPLDYRIDAIPKALEYQGCERGAIEKVLWKQYEQRELHANLSQLHDLYRNNRPDLVLYDLRNLAGKV